jgi:hypothetical protein
MYRDNYQLYYIKLTNNVVNYHFVQVSFSISQCFEHDLLRFSRHRSIFHYYSLVSGGVSSCRTKKEGKVTNRFFVLLNLIAHRGLMESNGDEVVRGTVIVQCTDIYASRLVE